MPHSDARSIIIGRYRRQVRLAETAGDRPADRETGKIDRYSIRGDYQTVAGGGEIIRQLVRARLTDRSACLDWNGFSRAGVRHEDCGPKGRAQSKKGLLIIS